MKNAMHDGHALTLVAGDVDEKHIAARRRCVALKSGYQRYTDGREKSLRPGALVQWKAGMKNRKTPDYGEPMIVVELLEQPIIDTTFDSGSVYFRERLNLVLGFLDEDGDFLMLHFDARRFEAYTGLGTD